MAIELKKRVSKLLKKYHTVFDVLCDYEDFILDLPHTESTNRQFYLTSTKKHALKLTDIKKIKKDPKHEVLVIQPQEYNRVSILNNKDTDIIDDIFYSKTDRLAKTGSGAEMWIKVTNNFADWLEKLIPKIEKATANAKQAAEKAEQAKAKQALQQVQAAMPKNVKAIKAKPVPATATKQVSKAATKPKKVNTSAPNRVSKTVTHADSDKEMGWRPEYYRTEYELRGQLADVDLSALMPGDTIQLWVADIVSVVGECELPIIDLKIPNDRKDFSTRAVLELIVEKFVTPLSCDNPEDVIVFYSLLAALVSSSLYYCDEAERVALVREFETGGHVAPLPLLRIGKYLPVADAIRPLKNRNGKVVKRTFELKWTN
jgi:hypothetical protein